MSIQYSNREFVGKGSEKEVSDEQSEKARKNRSKDFCKNFWESTKGAMRVLAMAVGATVLAYGCALDIGGRYKANDVHVDDVTEVDSVPDYNEVDVPDVEVNDDEMDAPHEPDPEVIDEDVNDVETEDVVDDEDSEMDVVEEDAIEEDVIDDEVTDPVCFDIPVPIDPTVDTLLLNAYTQSATFSGPGSTSISANTVKYISMTGYPSVVLGQCPATPSSVAFLAAPGSVYTFNYDTSVTAGGSWSATVPYLSGTLCPPLSADSLNLVSRNTTSQQVPKNAVMSGTPTQAGFELQGITATMVAYDINGIRGTSGSITVGGSDFLPVNTAKTVIVDRTWDVEVEVRAGGSIDTHTYSGTLTGGESKEARVYPKAPSDNQMYEVTWDESEKIWCGRCIGSEVLVVVIPGDLICKVSDACGCVGDGFTINILSVTLDKSSVVPMMQGFYEESSPPVRSASGVDALSDPSTDHPSVNITLERNRTDGLFDDGRLANLTLVVSFELVSQHYNPAGTRDTLSVTLHVPLVDPWATGSVRPNYASDCSCTPIY